MKLRPISALVCEAVEGPSTKRLCTVKDCDRPYLAKGFCSVHWQRSTGRTKLPMEHPVRGQRLSGQLCEVVGCDRERTTGTMCGAHYQRKRTGRKSLADPIVQRTKTWAGAVCRVTGCYRPVAAMFLCSAHYARSLKGSDLTNPIRKARHSQGDICAILGCDRLAKTKGMCIAHYVQHKKGKKFTAPKTPVDQSGRPMPISYAGMTCEIDGCGRRAKSFGLCPTHYRRSKQGVDLTAPVKAHKRPVGYRRVDANGYVHVRQDVPPDATNPDGARWYVREHQAVMEQVIGRQLLRHESVHHINGKRDDNRPENLELWSKHHPSGQRVADKVAFSIEILATYPEFIGLDLVDLMLLKSVLDKVRQHGQSIPKRSRRTK